VSRNYKMQKRHYQLIADIIRALPGIDSSDAEWRKKVAEHFADSLRKTNPLFSRERFLEACEKSDYPRRETRYALRDLPNAD
jgi:hypothetical protein